MLGNVGPFIAESGLTYNNYMISVDNLIRLGVLKQGAESSQSYSEIINNTIEIYKRSVHLDGIETYQAEKKTLCITSFGQSFINNCITTELKGMPLHMYS